MAFLFTEPLGLGLKSDFGEGAKGIQKLNTANLQRHRPTSKSRLPKKLIGAYLFL